MAAQFPGWLTMLGQTQVSLEALGFQLPGEAEPAEHREITKPSWYMHIKQAAPNGIGVMP